MATKADPFEKAILDLMASVVGAKSRLGDPHSIAAECLFTRDGAAFLAAARAAALQEAAQDAYLDGLAVTAAWLTGKSGKEPMPTAKPRVYEGIASIYKLCDDQGGDPALYTCVTDNGKDSWCHEWFEGLDDRRVRVTVEVLDDKEPTDASP